MSLKMNLRDKLDGDTLDLSMSDLQEVPVREIAPIRKATHLDLSNNRLVSLPKNFISLTQIVRLDLSKNMLTEIPENFGEMRQLRHLDLYSNQISRLPLSLGELKNLKWLDLKENPLTPAVASVAGLCSDARECQACARNVVAYLAHIKSSINEEMLRRSNAISTVEPERDVPLSKKELKRRKKKSDEKENKLRIEKQLSGTQKVERHDINGDVPASRLQPDDRRSIKPTLQKGGVVSRLCRPLILIVFWLIAFGFLATLFIMTLPLINKERSEAITNYIAMQTGLPVKRYQELGTENFEMLIDNVISWTDKAQTLLVEMYAKYFGEALATSKRDF